VRSSDVKLAQVLLDLDRCQHGRHSKDPCLSCPGGQSQGNTLSRPGQQIGFGLDGTLIVVPEPGDRYDADAWRRPRPAAGGEPR